MFYTYTELSFCKGHADLTSGANRDFKCSVNFRTYSSEPGPMVFISDNRLQLCLCVQSSESNFLEREFVPSVQYFRNIAIYVGINLV